MLGIVGERASWVVLSEVVKGRGDALGPGRKRAKAIAKHPQIHSGADGEGELGSPRVGLRADAGGPDDDAPIGVVKIQVIAGLPVAARATVAHMSPDGTRAAVVRAALPLIGQYDSLTTAQIAHAAGVDEADLLREFEGKDAILHACMAHLETAMARALDHHEVLRDIGAIPTDQPLATRLVEVIGVLERYNDRVFASIEALLQPPSPMTLDTDPASVPGTRSMSRDDVRAITRRPEVLRAVADLLTPDREHLRMPTDTLANAFLRMYLSAVRISHPARPHVSAEEIVDLFLHGALTGTNTTR